MTETRVNTTSPTTPQRSPGHAKRELGASAWSTCDRGNPRAAATWVEGRWLRVERRRHRLRPHRLLLRGIAPPFLPLPVQIPNPALVPVCRRLPRTPNPKLTPRLHPSSSPLN